MARLIDAEKLKQHYAWWAKGSEMRKHFKSIFDEIINLQPTVEAVGVVRCKECRFYQGECCRRYGRSAIPRREPNDFCSKGEPRND